MKVAERKAPVPPDITAAWIWRASHSIDSVDRSNTTERLVYGLMAQLRAVADIDNDALTRRLEQHLSWLEGLPYKEYLLTEDWQITRRFALERARYRCQGCNSPRDLQVHHRSYDNVGCEAPEDLTVLCDGCHGTFHGHRELVRGAA